MRQILTIYEQDFEIYTKQDASPVTKADQLAEEIIVRGLQELTPDIPIIAEEMAAENALPKLDNPTKQQFYLVDPLDGTKEFINKRAEFTVNIALIENQTPIIGIIFAPVLGLLYVGDVKNNIAFEYKLNSNFDLSNPISQIDISAAKPASSPYKILASRSHMNTETEAYIKDLHSQQTKIEIVNIGSSLKLCLLAAGKADIYPRFGPTMEWDTAAGHAILTAAKGRIEDEFGNDFAYGDQANSFRNGNFIAFAN